MIKKKLMKDLLKVREILNTCLINKGAQVGLRYNMNSSKKYFNNYFIKASKNYHPSITCNYCGKNGQISHVCFRET